MQHLSQVSRRNGLDDPKRLWLVAGALVGAEEQVHERGDVGVVAGVAGAVVVPVVELGGADEHAQRSDREADIRVDVDGPDAAEGDEGGEGLQREAEDEDGKVDQAHRVDGVDGVFAVGGQPVEVFGAVVDGMEPPQEADAVLEAVAPVDAEVAEKNHFDRLDPEGLGGDARAEGGGDEGGDEAAEAGENPKDGAAPEEILAEEEAEVGEPGGAEELLAGSGGEDVLQGAKD